MQIVNSKGLRRTVEVWVGCAFAALIGYYISCVAGHPLHEWASIYSAIPPALQYAPVPFVSVGALGQMWRWSRAGYQSSEAARRENLEGAADTLARDLKAAAEEEIKSRGLVSPEPLEVRWRRMARSEGAAGPLLHPRGGIATRRLSEVADVYLSLRGTVQQTRFVIIGEAGSGKTALTLFTQLGMLRHRARNPAGSVEPVPVVLPLSSWNPETKFTAWAAGRLQEIAPELGFPMKLGKKNSTVAMCMIKEDKVVLILDAMDEMPEDFLRKAFGAINEQIDPDSPLIITCRTEAYAATLGSGKPGATHAGAELANATVLELQPPTVVSVQNYLRQSSSVDLQGAWQPILEHLDQEPHSPVTRTLTNPLMVWLTGKIYRADPARLAGYITDRHFTSPSEVEEHLLSSLVASVFSQAEANLDLERAWKAARSEKWLRYLASWIRSREGRMIESQTTEGMKKDPEPDNAQDIAWWRLVEAPEAAMFARIGAALFGGLAAGGAVGLGLGCIFWNTLGHRGAFVFSLVLGIFTAVVMGYDCARKSPPPTSKQFGLPKYWGAPAMAGIVVLVLAGAAGVFMAGSATGLWWGLMIATPVAASYAFGTPFVDIARVATPKALYRSDISQTIMYTAAYAVTLGVLAGVYHGAVVGVILGVLAGLSGGFTYGVIYKIVFKRNIPGMVAWLRFRMAHAWLAATGRLPWRLFGFLNDAHKLGVLRQTGPNYQFSHIKLRDQLAKSIDNV